MFADATAELSHVFLHLHEGLANEVLDSVDAWFQLSVFQDRRGHSVGVTELSDA